MVLPPPTVRQSQIIWNALTALAVALFAGVIVLALWGAGWILNQLSAFLLPLAFAAVLACLLDPVVSFMELRFRIPRGRAIIMVFLLVVLVLLILAGTVVPQLIHEASELLDRFPDYMTKLRTQFSDWLAHSPRGVKIRALWDQHAAEIQQWLASYAPVAWHWFLARATQVASFVGLFLGLLLVPVYCFYLLYEKEKIQDNWTEYLPLRESRLKEELVFVVRSVNESLIVFFRGQVLVAFCVGTCTALGLFLIGLNYSLLLGFMIALLGIIPYLGVIVSFVPAVILAIVQFGDWRVLLVPAVFGIVQTLDGFFISPKIIGDRVGLHPLTIIIAVMLGTTLLGGILGGILAIPLTAALRTLMFRYVWKKKEQEASIASGTSTI